MKKIINKLKKFFTKIMAPVFAKSFFKKPDQIKAVAIVLFGGLGDGVLWIQYANQIIKHYEEMGYKIYLICNKSLEQLYKNYTNFNNIIVVNNNLFNSMKDLKNALKEINSVYFEEIIDIRLTKEKSQDLYLIKHSKAKYKTGYFENFEDKKDIKLQNSLFNKLITIPSDQHEINNHYCFLKNIGIEIEQDLFYLKKFVNIRENQDYITVCVGASDPKRMWDVNNWIQVIKYILDNSNYKIYFCGAKQEEYVYNIINDNVKDERLINKCGKTTLQELIDLLGNSKFVLANDSGPGHIASSVGAKGLILLGGGYNFRFFPHKNIKNETTEIRVVCKQDKCWNCSWGCTKSKTDFPCMKQITAEMIISELSNFIKD